MLRVSDHTLFKFGFDWQPSTHKNNQMQVSVPRDLRSNLGKGFAFVQYFDNDAAKSALVALDGQAFHGRLLHIMPSPEKKPHVLDDYEISKLPLKKQKQIRRKTQAAASSFEWNSMYMNVSRDALTCGRRITDIVLPIK